MEKNDLVSIDTSAMCISHRSRLEYIILYKVIKVYTIYNGYIKNN